MAFCTLQEKFFKVLLTFFEHCFCFFINWFKFYRFFQICHFLVFQAFFETFDKCSQVSPQLFDVCFQFFNFICSFFNFALFALLKQFSEVDDFFFTCETFFLKFQLFSLIDNLTNVWTPFLDSFRFSIFKRILYIRGPILYSRGFFWKFDDTCFSFEFFFKNLLISFYHFSQQCIIFRISEVFWCYPKGFF